MGIVRIVLCKGRVLLLSLFLSDDTSVMETKSFSPSTNTMEIDIHATTCGLRDNYTHCLRLWVYPSFFLLSLIFRLLSLLYYYYFYYYHYHYHPCYYHYDYHWYYWLRIEESREDSSWDSMNSLFCSLIIIFHGEFSLVKSTLSLFCT